MNDTLSGQYKKGSQRQSGARFKNFVVHVTRFENGQCMGHKDSQIYKVQSFYDYTIKSYMKET